MPSGADENTGAVTAVLSYVEDERTKLLVSFTSASSDRKTFQNFKVSSPAHISIICPLGDTARYIPRFLPEKIFESDQLMHMMEPWRIVDWTTYLSSRSMSISKRSLPFFMFRASHRRRRPSPPTEGNDQTSRA
ncbi:hypothetical protein HID58_033680 [Brassica napus]|uniref:Uncharacterized protein n=1 Tax=Brassica napus TaxID=3708 RepID=A0ABQ8BZY0_BRANA|nr:hypothetical protein HID58_033680 [Brassica napus]